ncbi:MAG: hypothetical protein E6I91_21825 [Chloroflexi bacterium]|nr:MAG: hypothetical protein E6I91_21825 [Chloroflexota bacterium]
MVVLAEIVLSPIALDSILIISVLLAIIGTLYLAYDLLGRQQGPLQWLTLVITCGLISALVLGSLAPIIRFLFEHRFDFGFTFQAMIIGGVMGVFTATLIDFPPAQARPSIVSRRGSCIGLGLGLLFFFVTFFLMSSTLINSLIMGLTCATLASLWPYLTWDSSPSKPQVFSRKGLGMGLLLGLVFWFVFFFIASRDVVVALLASVPFALVCGALISLWRFIHWEASSPQTRVFSRKGLLGGFVIGFIPWLTFQLTENYPAFLHVSGPVVGFQLLGNIVLNLVFIVGVFALANAAAGSISRYLLWKANALPLRALGAIGLILLLLSFSLQVVAPAIDLINILLISE